MQTLLYFYEIVNKYSAWIEASAASSREPQLYVLGKNVPAKDVSGWIRVSMLFSCLMDAAAHAAIQPGRAASRSHGRSSRIVETGNGTGRWRWA
jgi:hypothetical protein